MASGHQRVRQQSTRLLQGRTLEDVEARLKPCADNQPPAVPGGTKVTPAALDARWALLGSAPPGARELILDAWSREQAPTFARNIENYLGTVRLPVGLAGPLRVRGLFAQGDYYVPLATTEAAMVASYARGALAITQAGGCSAMLVAEGISRAPGFAFANLSEVGRFVLWVTEHLDALKACGQSTTRHGLLADVRINIEANHVFINFDFTTADASGQNLVTIATQAMFDMILRDCPVKPARAYIEANHSGDKKATTQSFATTRGRKVSAEVVLPAELTRRRLHASPMEMAQYSLTSAVGSVLSGALGIQGHYANALAALFIATGQDAACVAESAIGLTRLEVTASGDLYAAVTLPALMLGTVGGGTALPTQRACLEIMGLAGPDHASALAEVCAALVLAGELSISAALASGEFSRAHARLARGKRLAVADRERPDA